MACEVSQSEVILAAGNVNGANGTTLTKDVNTSGAEKLYTIRKLEVVPFTSPTASVIQGSITNIANSIDQNLSTGAGVIDGTTATDPIAQYDYGSVATRRFAAYVTLTGGPAGTFSYRANTDGNTATPTTWTAWTVFNSGSIAIAATTNSCRHFQIKFVVNSSTIGTANINEQWDAEEGGYGTFSTKFEIFDTARSTWLTIPDSGAFTILSSLGITSEITISGIMPYATSGLFRVSYTTIGHVNVSITMVKVKPCTP